MDRNGHHLSISTNEELCAVVAERLMQRRKAAGWNQEELAARLGLSRQSVSKWECGDCLPDTVNLLALARLYGTSVDELLGREVTDNKEAASGAASAEDPALLSASAELPAMADAADALEVLQATPVDSLPKEEAGDGESSEAGRRIEIRGHAAPSAASASRPLSARLPQPIVFSTAWLAIVMIAATVMSMGYAAYTWLPIIPLYCWIIITLEKDAAHANAVSHANASGCPNNTEAGARSFAAEAASPTGTNDYPGSTSMGAHSPAAKVDAASTVGVETQTRIALVALATIALCASAFIFMIGWTAGCGPWGLPWVPAWYLS